MVWGKAGTQCFGDQTYASRLTKPFLSAKKVRVQVSRFNDLGVEKGNETRRVKDFNSVGCRISEAENMNQKEVPTNLMTESLTC